MVFQIWGVFQSLTFPREQLTVSHNYESEGEAVLLLVKTKEIPIFFPDISQERDYFEPFL